jgi:hypothetical protein
MSKKPRKPNNFPVDITAAAVPLELPRIVGLKHGETLRYAGRYDQLDGNYFWDIVEGQVVSDSEVVQ